MLSNKELYIISEALLHLMASTNNAQGMVADSAAIEQCVEVYNKLCSYPIIIIKDKPLKGHTVIVKKHFNEIRVAVKDSLSAEDKLRELVYIFGTNTCLFHVFSYSGNWHVWASIMRYVLFGEFKKEEIRVRCGSSTE